VSRPTISGRGSPHLGAEISPIGPFFPVHTIFDRETLMPMALGSALRTRANLKERYRHANDVCRREPAKDPTERTVRLSPPRETSVNGINT
jgi:hypothetical protein